MPHHDHNTADTPVNRPVTRQKNATTHPGIDAQRALSSRRLPELIEQEKLERKAKKEAKERRNLEETKRKEAAQQRVEALRAEQAIEIENEEIRIPRQQRGDKKNKQGARVPGKGNVIKARSSVTVNNTDTATPEGNRGQKRKSDVRQQLDDDTGHGENLEPPAKKGKLPAQTHEVPRPRRVQNKTQVQEEETMDRFERHNAKKRPSEAADGSDPENGPKTPVPSKKAKIQHNKSKAVPIRRTETMIELAGSKVVTRRPTDINRGTTSDEDADDEEATARARTPIEDVDNEPYQTPVALTPRNLKKATGRGRVMVEETGTESDVESSEIEVVEREVKKRAPAPTSAADKLSATKVIKLTQRTATHGDKSTQPKTHSIPSLSSRSSNAQAAPKSLNSRTTALNEVAAARSLDGPTSKSKPKVPTKTSKKRAIVEDGASELDVAVTIGLGDEDDTKEREAALSSPMKGKDSRQSTATQVKVERGEEEMLSASEKKKVKDDVIPHFMQKYTSQNDCFAPLTEKDFKLLDDLCHRVMGRPLPNKLTKNSDVVKMVSAKLSDYRTQFRIQGDNNARDLLSVYFHGDASAVQDKEKRIEFGLYYCKEDEYKFQFKGSDRIVGKFKASGRFLSKIFLDTFAIHYRYSLPKNPLPNWDTPIPVGGLALAAAAVDRALTLYRDDHYVYENGNLSIKQPPISQAAKEKAMKNRAARGGQDAEIDKVPCTSKFHFSKGKYGSIVLAWHGVLIQKAKANFPEICAQARKIFGVADVEAGSGNQPTRTVDPAIRTRVGLDSESEGESEDEGEDESEDEGEDEDRGHNGGGGLEHYGDDNEEDAGYGHDSNNNGEGDGNDGPSGWEVVSSHQTGEYDDHDDVDADQNEETEEVDCGGPSR